MKSLLETLDFNKKQCLNIIKIMLGTFMHNSYDLIADNGKGMNKSWTKMHKSYVFYIKHLGFISQNMFKCSIKPGQHARTLVPVPSTCTKRENQVLFIEK